MRDASLYSGEMNVEREVFLLYFLLLKAQQPLGSSPTKEYLGQVKKKNQFSEISQFFEIAISLFWDIESIFQDIMSIFWDIMSIFRDIKSIFRDTKSIFLYSYLNFLRYYVNFLRY